MRINGVSKRTIWLADDGRTVQIYDQRYFPHRIEIIDLTCLDDAATAITEMAVRGAPLIGGAAAFGMALAMIDDPSDQGLQAGYDRLIVARPTAVNLRWALDDLQSTLTPLPAERRAARAFERAQEICDLDVAICCAIGDAGLNIIREIAAHKPAGAPVNILTHCNAGWLATIDWGTATAPIYKARDAGIPVHVWVGETRPRNQGASLTAFELLHEEIDHTVVVDNTGGHLMQHGMVDLCIVGTDRTTRSGDVCNKIGTYLKALAAHDNQVPFYVALPSTTIDWTISDGIREVPIEQRAHEEVTVMHGLAADGSYQSVQITPTGSPAANYAFDVTPAHLVTGLITERGVVAANEKALTRLFDPSP